MASMETGKDRQEERLPKMGNRVFRHFRRVRRLLKVNGWALIRFEIAYRLLTFFFFFPLLAYSQRLFLIISRSTNITWENADEVAANPLTWFLGFFLVILMTIFAAFEQYAIADAIHAAKWGRRRNVRGIFSAGFDLALRNIRPKNWVLLLYLLVIMHFSRFYDTSSITRGFDLPGFVREHMEKYPYIYAFYVLLCVVMLFLDLRWMFSIPIMAGTDKPFHEAVKDSVRLTKGRVGRLFGMMAVSTIAARIVYSVGGALFIGFMYLFLYWLDPSVKPDFRPNSAVVQTAGLFLTMVGSWGITVIFQTCAQNAWYERLEELGEKIPEYLPNQNYLMKHPLLRRSLVAVLLFVCFFSIPSRYQQVKWMVNGSGLPMIMAHRGYSDAAPENTIPAFQAALDAGVESVELDVQMTKDGTVIVLHDDSLKRTAGLDKKVWEVTWEEIRDLDNGSFFSENFAGTKIPTLDEVLKTFRGRLYFNIEIKRTGHYEGIEQKVVEIIRQNDCLASCDVTSQDYRTLELVKEANPDVLTAYTTAIGIGDIENLQAADIISIQETFATFQEVKRLHAAGKRVFVWTVKDKDAMNRLVSLNVDAILTNNPVLGLEVLEEHRNRIDDLYSRISDVLSYL